MSPLSVVKNNKIRNSLVANRSVFKLFLTEKYKQNPLIFDRVLHFLSESVLDWHDPSSLSLLLYRAHCSRALGDAMSNAGNRRICWKLYRRLERKRLENNNLRSLIFT